VRRVSAGEASQFDGVLHKGLPLRVLSKSDLILKTGGKDLPFDDEAFNPSGRPEAPEGLEDEPEGSLEDCVTKLIGLVSQAMNAALDCEEYGLSAQYSTALQDMHTKLGEEGLGDDGGDDGQLGDDY